MKFLLFFYILAQVAMVISSKKNKTECFQCQGDVRCSGVCQALYCIKTVHLQSNYVTRDCVSHLTPDMPQPGNCKKFDSDVGNQEELICLCDSHRCNLATSTSLSIFAVISAFLAVLLV